MNLPYGQNEGDSWTAEGSVIQEDLDREGEGLMLIHIFQKGEDCVYTTGNESLIRQAQRGDTILGTVLCPRCGRYRYQPYGSERLSIDRYAPPALSRLDNATYICNACGQDEAMRDFNDEPPLPVSEWPLKPLPLYADFGRGRDV